MGVGEKGRTKASPSSRSCLSDITKFPGGGAGRAVECECNKTVLLGRKAMFIMMSATSMLASRMFPI